MEADAATAEEVVVEAVAASCHVSLMPVEASLGHGQLRTYQVVYFAVVGHPRAGVVISDGWEDVQRRRTLRRVSSYLAVTAGEDLATTTFAVAAVVNLKTAFGDGVAAATSSVVVAGSYVVEMTTRTKKVLSAAAAECASPWNADLCRDRQHLGGCWLGIVCP